MHSAIPDHSGLTPDGETAGLWKIEGGQLWVRDGASFPDVDLLSGVICPPQAVVTSLRVKAKQLEYAELLWFAGVCACLYAGLSYFWIIALFFVRFLVPRRRLAATIFFVSNLRLTPQQGWLQLWLQLLPPLLIIAGVLLAMWKGMATYWWNVGLLISGGVLIVIAKLFNERRVAERFHFSRCRDGWFHLDSVNEKIIAHLSAAASSPASPNHPQ